MPPTAARDPYGDEDVLEPPLTAAQTNQMPTVDDESPEPADPEEPETGTIPPTLDLAALVAELVDQLTRAAEWLQAAPAEQFRDLAADPLRALLTIAERLGVDWASQTDQLATFARARMSGDYSVDEFGFDPQFTTELFLPVMRWLAQNWFRVEVRGAENIPTSGSALLVSNHAGTMPLDSMVLHSVVYDEVGSPR